MWSIFEAKFVKVVSFSILHDFASTDLDALRINSQNYLTSCLFYGQECPLISVRNSSCKIGQVSGY